MAKIANLPTRKAGRFPHLKKLLFVSLVFALSSQTTYGQRQSCTVAQAEKAEQEADGLRTWDALYKSFHRFSHCDDGAIAEGYSESVARILADHWEALPRFAVLPSNDKPFQKFVLGHVDATLNMDDVKTIRTNAIHHCPAAQSDLCKQLRVAAESAMKE